MRLYLRLRALQSIIPCIDEAIRVFEIFPDRPRHRGPLVEILLLTSLGEPDFSSFRKYAAIATAAAVR
jgi:hypothetical protein